MHSDKTSLQSVNSQRSQKKQTGYGQKAKQQNQLLDIEINQQRIQFEENERKMKKIRLEARQRKQEKETRLKSQQNQELLLQEQRKQLKKENLQKIRSQKREDPQKMQGNLRGLDLDVKNSVAIFEKIMKENMINDDIFVVNNRLLESLDLSASNLFMNQMNKQLQNDFPSQANNQNCAIQLLAQKPLEDRLKMPPQGQMKCNEQIINNKVQNQPQNQQKPIQRISSAQKNVNERNQQFPQRHSAHENEHCNFKPSQFEDSFLAQGKDVNTENKIDNNRHNCAELGLNQRQKKQSLQGQAPQPIQRLQSEFNSRQSQVFEEIEELIESSAELSKNDLKLLNQETLSGVQHRNTPIAGQKRQSNQTSAKIDAKVLSKRILCQIAPVQVENASNQQFNANEFLKADLLNLNREENQLQKDLYSMEMQNQAQINNVYERNNIQRKYKHSQEVIQNNQILKPQQKTGNAEIDLERSLANLELALEQQKLKKYKHDQMMKDLELQQKAILRMDGPQKQPQFTENQLSQKNYQYLEDEQQQLQNYSDSDQNQKQVKMMSGRGEKVSRTSSQQGARKQKSLQRQSKEKEQEINKVQHSKLKVKKDEILRTAMNLEKKLAEISGQTNLFSVHQHKQSDASLNSAVNRENALQAITFCDDLNELKSNISQLSRFSGLQNMHNTQRTQNDSSFNNIINSLQNDQNSFLSNQKSLKSNKNQAPSKPNKNLNSYQEIKQQQNQDLVTDKHIKTKSNKKATTEPEIVEFKKEDHSLKVNHKLRNLLFEVEEDSLEN